MKSLFSSLLNMIASFFTTKKTSAPVEPQITPAKTSPVPVPSKVIDSVNDGNPARPDWSYLWDHCTIDPNRVDEVKKVCREIVINKEKYIAVESATTVPWYLIAALHYREASLNFKTYLGNGDPLNKVSTHVPRGRGPFKTWELGAIDALRYDGLDRFKYDSFAACLIKANSFNGIGYVKRGREYSPYVFAATNWSDETGKYVSDGVFSESAIEKQLGVAAIIKHLQIEGYL